MVFSEGAVEMVSSLSGLGIVFLMLLVGSEMSLGQFRKVSVKAAYLAVLGYIIPFSLGFLMMRAFGFDMVVSLILGVTLAVSAGAIAVDLLTEYDMLRTRAGAIIMESGMMDDVLGVLSLAVIVGYLEGFGFDSAVSLAADFMLFIFAAYVLGFVLLPRAARLVWREKSEAAVFSLAIIFGLVIVMLSSVFGVSSIIGAFVAGLIINASVKNRVEENEMVESLNIVTFGLVIPFFFVYTGMSVDLSKVWGNIHIIVALIVLGFVGKLAAAHIMGGKYHISRDRRLLIGWGMSCKGAVELVIANIARSKGLIGDDVFSIIILVAVLSAIISPMMFKRHCHECSKGKRHCLHAHSG
jgi:Kef-type K+ transport system membrane component KefB